MVGFTNALLSKSAADTVSTSSSFRPSSPCFVPQRLCPSLEPGLRCRLTPSGHRNDSVSVRYLLKINRDLTKFPVPVIGMLSGNSISAIVVSIDYVLKEFV